MAVVARLDQYASMLATEFDDYSMSENLLYNTTSTSAWSGGTFTTETTYRIKGLDTVRVTDLSSDSEEPYLQGQGIDVGTYTVSHYIDTTNSTCTTFDVILYINHNNSGGYTFSYAKATFTLSTKTFGSITYYGPAWSNGTTNIINYGGGIYRISVSATTSLVGTSTRAYVSPLSLDSSYAIVAGSQYETGSVATDYTPTTGTTISRVLPYTTNTNITGLGTYYSSGFDENSIFTTLVQTGENLFQRSEEFDNAYWTVTNLRGTITANQTTAPDGNITADLYQEDATTNGRYFAKSISVTSGTSYTVSIWTKQASGSTRYLGLVLPTAGFGVNVTASFTLSGVGSYTISTSGTSTSAGIQAYPNGWYRCYLTSQATASANPAFQFRLSNSSTNGTPNYLGDGTSGIYVWGVQIERGLAPTDYIPTTTTSRSRSLPTAFAASANVLPPYDPVYDEFAGVLYGPGKGTFMKQYNDKSVIVYNEIDEIATIY